MFIRKKNKIFYQNWTRFEFTGKVRPSIDCFFRKQFFFNWGASKLVQGAGQVNGKNGSFVSRCLFSRDTCCRAPKILSYRFLFSSYSKKNQVFAFQQPLHRLIGCLLNQRKVINAFYGNFFRRIPLHSNKFCLD